MPLRRFWRMMLLMGVAGCQGLPGGTDDPLLGGVPVSTRMPYVGRPADPPSNPAELPPTHSPAAPAALAMGAVNAGNRRAAGQDVSLEAPRVPEGRLAPVGASGADAPVPVASSAAGGGESFEQLQQMLLARGVVWQQLKNVERDEWHFICAIPDAGQPNVRYTYDVKAVGPMGLAAIRAAIEKIDSERR